eukprot:c2825_g1_i2 orf=271-2997(-)
MSQPQMQNRPSGVNGASRRRGDRDLGNRPENFRNEYQNHRPSRPGSSASTGAEGIGQSGHQRVGQTNSTQAGSPKPPGDKVEAFAGGDSRDGGQEPLSHHLMVLTACLIGQLVEVQVKNGSIYSGVFHTASADKDYGVVLKVARLVRDGSSKGKVEAAKELTRKPIKTLIIRAKDLVQIIAKDVPVYGEVPQNGRARENRAEIVTDSFLSQGRHGEVERELKPWTPDKDDPRDLGLDSTFQNSWNRNWDQFEINKTLFGVESTFDEHLYTTKLERGPQMRDREREAWRIAREIEGQSTKKLHLAEERGGIDDIEALDEESRFSSVLRPSEDVGDEYDDTNLNIVNNETFGDSFHHTTAITAAGSIHELTSESLREAENGRFNRPDLVNSNEDSISSLMDINAPTSDSSSAIHNEKSHYTVGGDTNKHVVKVGGLTSPVASVLVGDTTSIQALNLDPGCRQVPEDVYREFNEFRQQENAKRGKKQREDQVNELKSFSESLKELTVKQQTIGQTGGTRKTAALSTDSSSSSTILRPDAGTSTVVQSHCLSSSSSEELMRVPSAELDSVEIPSTSGNFSSSAQSSIETTITSLNSAPSTTAPSSPSSSSGVSTGADSHKKSTLNPNAKEFKLNPNAKSFTPRFTPPRPPSPAVQGSVYVPGVMPSVAQIQGMPVGVSVNPLLQSVGQSGTKYAPYNPVAVAAASGTNPYLPSPGTYTSGVSGAAVSPVLGGHSTMKVPPQLQQPVAGQSYGSQQPIRYTSQASSVQPTSTYLHPNGHLYSQPVMFGQPGQVVYIQPYPQGPPMQSLQAASQQSQAKHRAPGAGVQGVQLCVAPPPYIAGQQHFLPQVQVPQLSNPLQPTPGVLAPSTMSAIQPPQGVIGGMVTPTQPNSGTLSGASVMRVAGKFVGVNFQQ